MKTITVIFITLLSLMAFSQTTLHDFKVKTIDGEEYDLATLTGKKVMIVNVRPVDKASHVWIFGRSYTLNSPLVALYNSSKQSNNEAAARPQ